MDKDKPISIYITLMDGTKYTVKTTKKELECANIDWTVDLPTCGTQIKFSEHDELAED